MSVFSANRNVQSFQFAMFIQRTPPFCRLDLWADAVKPRVIIVGTKAGAIFPGGQRTVCQTRHVSTVCLTNLLLQVGYRASDWNGSPFVVVYYVIKQDR